MLAVREPTTFFKNLPNLDIYREITGWWKFWQPLLTTSGNVVPFAQP